MLQKSSAPALSRRSSYVTGVQNYMSIMEYNSSSFITTKTTTRTKIVSPMLCEGRPRTDVVRHCTDLNNSSFNNINIDDDDMDSTKPLLLVVEHYDQETTTNTTTTPFNGSCCGGNELVVVKQKTADLEKFNSLQGSQLSEEDDEEEEQRETWGRKIDFLLSVSRFFGRN